MPNRISFALAIHNHQPVGNFGWVFAEVFDLAYAPMVDALERSSRACGSRSTTPVRCSSGCAPSGRTFVDRLRDLVEPRPGRDPRWRLCEPVLASLPERDRVGQLTRMGDELERLFGRRPRGAWLAERVWEP